MKSNEATMLEALRYIATLDTSQDASPAQCSAVAVAMEAIEKTTTMKKKTNHSIISPELGETLDRIRQIDPLLVAARAALHPFDDLFFRESWGPQPQAKDFNPDEEPHFSVDVQAPGEEKRSYNFKFTRAGIEMSYWELLGVEEEMLDEPVEITLPQLFEFLRQLPRGAYSFIK